VRAPAVIMEPPDAKDPPQVVLPERNQKVQTLSPQTSEEALTIRIRHWGVEAHRREGGVEPRRDDAVPIVEDQTIAVRFRQGHPELLEGPRGGGMRRGVDGQ
jgi:hypothetical protein